MSLHYRGKCEPQKLHISVKRFILIKQRTWKHIPIIILLQLNHVSLFVRYLSNLVNAIKHNVYTIHTF